MATWRSLALILIAACVRAGEDPKTIHAWLGATPKLDGIISPGEYADATEFRGPAGWAPQFLPITDPKDLSLRAWVKHDGRRLYFAFDVTDDVLYGIDTPRWLPRNNAKAHDLTREGFPWFGDEIEILINATNRWTANEDSAGNGTSWQMVCNLTKSRKGGIGVGGLLEGEPRRLLSAWDTYARWIADGAQECVAKPRPGGYIVEWAISFDPCLEISPGAFYTTALGDRRMGVNILIGDLDRDDFAADNPYGFHHENSWAGARNTRTHLRDFGTLIVHAGRMVR
jgi:SSS family solute:Na+ symporter